jgi:hypothetical protein
MRAQHSTARWARESDYGVGFGDRKWQTEKYFGWYFESPEAGKACGRVEALIRGGL